MIVRESYSRDLEQGTMLPSIGRFFGGMGSRLLLPRSPNNPGNVTAAAAGFTTRGRRPNGFLGLTLNDRTILFLVILLDKTVSVG